ncbi:MAG: hypothetical protein HC914_17730 [Chloroflexaceae bacterium]|nr:hypothetical protein [Chloroflexaceae bacterium]
MILKGEFGRTPAPVNEEILKRVMGPNDKPLQYRVASYLMPVLEDEYNEPFIRSRKDLLLYLAFKQAATTFLKKRYGVE